MNHMQNFVSTITICDKMGGMEEGCEDLVFGGCLKLL